MLSLIKRTFFTSRERDIKLKQFKESDVTFDDLPDRLRRMIETAKDDSSNNQISNGSEESESTRDRWSPICCGTHVIRRFEELEGSEEGQH